MSKVTELAFGAPAAERDIGQGLADYFVDTEAFKRVQDGSKTVVLGNRGTGKSAIFQVLAQRERHRRTLVVEFAPEDYSYEMLSRTMAAENEGSWAKIGAYAAAWKYLIFIEVMKGLSRMGLGKQPAEAAIRKYLRDNHKGFQGNPIAGLISYLKRIEGIKLGPYEASIGVRELERLYKLEEIQHLMPALQQVCQKQKVIILVDELDRGWDASEDAKAFVAGLFQACININRLTPNLRVYMSLRQELYDSIPALYEDVQKYRDLIEIISWDAPSLLKLVAGRIRYSLQAADDVPDIQCWHKVFAREFSAAGTDSFSYIADRTLHRPREIISFCAEALETAQARSKPLPFDHAVVSEAELSYSEERTKDIAAEYRHQYPGLLHVFEHFRGGPCTLDRDELENLCLELALGERRLAEPAGWLLDQDPESIIHVLWRIGFLTARTRAPAQPGNGSHFVGPHQAAHLGLQHVEQFQIHPMFRAYLGLSEELSVSVEPALALVQPHRNSLNGRTST